MNDHSNRAHALLSPSSSSRWLHCTPSAKLNDTIEEKTSIFAAEGTLAHELAEVMLQKSLKEITPQKATPMLKNIKDHELYSEDMPDYVQVYVDYCLEQYYAARKKDEHATALIEQKVDLTAYVPHSFGANDFAIIGGNTLEIIDLKYGQGVRVEAEGNSQLKLYAIGAVEALGFFYDIKHVKMTIVQPRLDHISSWQISKEELMLWAEGELKTKAALAINGTGELCAGDWCKFCKAAPRCRALADLTAEQAINDFSEAKLEYKDPKTLSDEELVKVYENIKIIEGYLKSVAQYMLDEAHKGKKWLGYKLVAGKGRRELIIGDDELQKVIAAHGISLDKVVNTKLKGIGELEKGLPKPVFSDVFGPYIQSKEGAAQLVPNSDKRPQLDKNKEAAEDFLGVS